MSIVLDGTTGVTTPGLSSTSNATVTGTLGVTGTFTPGQTTGIVGTTTNNSAQAGSVGEYVEGVLVGGSATALTTNTAKTLVSISLTAGDWDVFGMVGVQPNPSAVYSYTVASASPTNNTLDTNTTNLVSHTQYPAATISTTTTDPRIALSTVRVSLASTTTYYLVVQSGFTVSSCLGYGRISARRVR